MRITPSSTWTGAIDNIWTNHGNWDVAPAAGADLVFPSGARRLVTVNTFPAGTSFNSITFNGPGYFVIGSKLSLNLGITADYASGRTRFDVDTKLGAGTVAVVQPGSTLQMNGALSGASGLTKTGDGELDLTGTSRDSYKGTTTVYAGTLVLSKRGVAAIPGDLVIGDGSGTSIVRETRRNQIDNTAAVTIQDSCIFDLNDYSDKIGRLTITGGTITTGTGTLTVKGDLTTNASARTAAIQGNLDLGGSNRLFSIADGAAANDLEISAIISGHLGTGFTKGGKGTLVLSGANTYDGTTRIKAGVVRISTENGLGSSAGGTQIVSGAALEVSGASAVVAEPLVVNGTGVSGTGAVRSLNGTNSVVGPMTLGTDSSVGVDAGQLMIGGTIDDGDGVSGLTKVGAGTLTLSGSSTYHGTTTVSAGSLMVNGSLNSAGRVAVSPGATLGGSGTVGTVSVTGGTVAPGDGPNVLNTGSISFTRASTYSVEIDANTPGNGVTGYDQLSATGAVDLGGATLSILLGSSYRPAIGDSLVVLRHNGSEPITGTFNGLPEGASLNLDTGEIFRITYSGGVSGNSVVLHFVQETTTTITSDNDPSVFGQPIALTASVSASSGTPDGAVEFYDGSTPIGIATLNSGLATLTFAALGAGNHSITAVYGGNSDVKGSVSPPLQQVVNQASTTSAVSTDANPSVFGQPVTFTATVNANSPGAGTTTGTVTFNDGATTLGSATLSGGSATLSISTLVVDTHSISVVYAGDTNFTGSASASVSQVVNQASTTTAVSTDANPSVFGQPVAFTATVTPNSPGAGTPTGTITFTDGATTLGSAILSDGSATLSISTLSIGTHAITVFYSGDSSFINSTVGPLLQVVNQASTTSAVSSDANPSVFGQPVTFTATVTANSPGAGTPTGTVTFTEGATTLGSVILSSGLATFSTTALSVGNHLVTALYGGDLNFAASLSQAAMQTVNPATTTTVLTTSADSPVVGQTVTFSAQVNVDAPGAGIATGTVTFFDGATPLGQPVPMVGGIATMTTSGLSRGSHSINAVYNGSGNDSGSTAQAIALTVAQASSTTALSLSPGNSVYGQPVSLTATVAIAAPGSGTATGQVTFMDGSASIGVVPLTGNSATLTLGTLEVGTHTITAIYAGDGNFTSSTSMASSLAVGQAETTTTLVASNNSAHGSHTIVFTAAISAVLPGSGNPSGTVTFYDGSTVLGTSTVSDGSASLSVDATGVHRNNVTAVYSGDSHFKPSSGQVITD